METMQGLSVMAAKAATAVLGFFLRWGVVLFGIAAWVAIAQGGEVRLQNYETCDAQSMVAFAHDNLGDMVGSPERQTRKKIYSFQDDIRRTCMQGKGYSISTECVSPFVSGSQTPVTRSECFRRSTYHAIAAQIK
jgi:hypothetical protein